MGGSASMKSALGVILTCPRRIAARPVLATSTQWTHVLVLLVRVGGPVSGRAPDRAGSRSPHVHSANCCVPFSALTSEPYQWLTPR